MTEVATVDIWRQREPIPPSALRTKIRIQAGLLTTLTTRVDKSLLSLAPNLRVISQMAVGVDNLDTAECYRRGIRIGHTPDVVTETVADTAFALIAAIVRRIPEAEKRVRQGQWGSWDPWEHLGTDLHGATLGIVGMGRIGRALVRRARGFDMKVIYATRTHTRIREATEMPLNELLYQAEIVVLCAPLTDETIGMIGLPELRLMGPNSYLVNIARGGLVKTEALVAALEADAIAGVALDVTDPEPIPPDHPLLTFSRCLVVPHIGSASHRTRRAMADLAVKNLIAGLLQEEMPAEFRPAL